MAIDPNPVHRRIIVPWYDSLAACLTVLALMTATSLFALVGISVTTKQPEYADCIVIPILLAGFSGGVIVSTVIRLIKRRLDRLGHYR